MYFAGGKPYEGVVWARAAKPVDAAVALESARRRTRYWPRPRSRCDRADWQRLEFTADARRDRPAGRFADLSLKQPRQTVDLGYVSLQPGEWGRFKGLPVRKDVAEALVDQGLTVLRYGGSMVNAPEYRWKKMIGPRDRRPPYKGTWYPYSTNGWGIIDFLDFCEAAGFLGIPGFNMDETPQDMADFVEYVNGPADSPGASGARPTATRRPIGSGTSSSATKRRSNEAYWQKFKPLAEAIWAERSVDHAWWSAISPTASTSPIPYDFAGAPSIKSLAAHKKILDFARAEPARSGSTCTSGTTPRATATNSSRARRADRLARQAQPRGRLQGLRVRGERRQSPAAARAGATPGTLNGLERFGSRVPIVCAANCLQPDGQNDNGWDQGLLFLSPAQVWAQPSYYVTQMISR